MYRMRLLFSNGKIVLSPVIQPDNPKHGLDDLSIIRSIDRTGCGMVRSLEHVIAYELYRGE